MPRQALTDTRDVLRDYDFRAGSLYLHSHGCPDPDRGIVRKRRTRSGRNPAPSTSSAREAAYSPRAHARKVEKAYARMMESQAAVKAARESGDEDARKQFALIARERRAEWLTISGTMPEGRSIEVDQGSAVNPMIAV